MIDTYQITDEELMKFTKKKLIEVLREESKRVDEVKNMSVWRSTKIEELEKEVNSLKEFERRYERECESHKSTIEYFHKANEEVFRLKKELAAKENSQSDNTINGDITGHEVECHNCLYWSPTKNGRGKCCVDPPKVSSEDSYIGVFPLTNGIDFCGKFTSKFQCTEDTGMYVDGKGNVVVDVIDIQDKED